MSVEQIPLEIAATSIACTIEIRAVSVVQSRFAVLQKPETGNRKGLPAISATIGSSRWQVNWPRGNSPSLMSSCFAGHDAPHLGQTAGLNAGSDLLGIGGLACVDRGYNFVLACL